MSIENLIKKFQDVVAHGTNPKDIVVFFSPGNKEPMPITGFTYGGADGKLELFCDES